MMMAIGRLVGETIKYVYVVLRYDTWYGLHKVIDHTLSRRGHMLKLLPFYARGTAIPLVEDPKVIEERRDKESLSRDIDDIFIKFEDILSKINDMAEKINEMSKKIEFIENNTKKPTSVGLDLLKVLHSTAGLLVAITVSSSSY